MSQGISSALNLLIARLEALTPKTDPTQGFVCVDAAGGQELLTDRRPNTLRLFEMRITTPAHDDGQAGITGRKRCTVEVRVRYDVPRDVGLQERMMGEDASQIINALRNPSYDLPNTGITSLITGEPLSTPVLGQDGNPMAILLSVPFDLLYQEAL
jgi:hypothetical protein